MDFISNLYPHWVNILGLTFNFIGVALVAYEWRTSMYDGLERLELEIA